MDDVFREGGGGFATNERARGDEDEGDRWTESQQHSGALFLHNQKVGVGVVSHAN